MQAFVQSLKTAVPELVLLGEGRPRLPNIAAIHIPGLDSEQAIAALDLMGIQVSGGAACASRSGKPSHVYSAMGLDNKKAAQVLRISIGRATTAEDLSACT